MWEVRILSVASAVVGRFCSKPYRPSPGALPGRGEEASVSLWICQREGIWIFYLLFLGLCPMPACEYRRWPCHSLSKPAELVYLVPNLALPLLSCITCTAVPVDVKWMISLDAEGSVQRLAHRKPSGQQYHDD